MCVRARRVAWHPWWRAIGVVGAPSNARCFAPTSSRDVHAARERCNEPVAIPITSVYLLVHP
jgi:hypothetical protein